MKIRLFPLIIFCSGFVVLINTVKCDNIIMGMFVGNFSTTSHLTFHSCCLSSHANLVSCFKC